MKKYTTATLFIFTGAVAAVFLLGLKNSPKTPTVNTNSPSLVANNTSNGSNITMAQVATHSQESDCYLVINQKAYDVTSYIGQHPGGRRNITSHCGQEVSGIFASIHSNFAWNLLGKYYVADIGEPSATTKEQQVLDDLKQKLVIIYPTAEIVSIKPKKDFYVAVMVDGGKLTEVHVTQTGKIISTEVQNDEFDWNAWDTDTDDN